MDDATYATLRTLVRQRIGIELGPGKQVMVAGRIGRRLRATGHPTIPAYVAALQADRDGDELIQLIDAISTNTTSFWREPKAFQHFDQAVRGWLAKGQRRFRFWSAAASTGMA
jgi:chemotaxis protein methyltransferase CheR